MTASGEGIVKGLLGGLAEMAVSLGVETQIAAALPVTDHLRNARECGGLKIALC